MTWHCFLSVLKSLSWLDLELCHWTASWVTMLQQFWVRTIIVVAFSAADGRTWCYCYFIFTICTWTEEVFALIHKTYITPVHTKCCLKDHFKSKNSCVQMMEILLPVWTENDMWQVRRRLIIWYPGLSQFYHNVRSAGFSPIRSHIGITSLWSILFYL